MHRSASSWCKARIMVVEATRMEGSFSINRSHLRRFQTPWDFSLTSNSRTISSRWTKTNMIEQITKVLCETVASCTMSQTRSNKGYMTVRQTWISNITYRLQKHWLVWTTMHRMRGVSWVKMKMASLMRFKLNISNNFRHLNNQDLV